MISQLAYWLWLFVNWTIKDSIDNRQTIQSSNFHYYYDRLNYIITLSMIMPYSKMSHQSHNFEPGDIHTQTRIQDFLILGRSLILSFGVLRRTGQCPVQSSLGQIEK